MNPELLIVPGIVSAAAAWAALCLSFWGVRISRRALRLNEIQEERRKPLIVPYLINGHYERETTQNGRVYTFLLSATNRSDSNNSVTRIDLRLSYRRKDGFEATVKIGCDDALAKAAKEKAEGVLIPPVRLDAHQSASGWCFFRVADALLDGSSVQSYSVCFTDSHGIDTTVESIIVREKLSGDETATG